MKSKTVLTTLYRLHAALRRGDGVRLNCFEIRDLLQLQGVQDEITAHELEHHAEREYYPPICYTPITGPAPDNALLNRCGFNDYGYTSFMCCPDCWCLKSSTGELSLRRECT